MTDILIKKKNIILDATLATALMKCACYVDLRFNHQFVPITGKGNSLEIGSIIHKILEVYYKNIIKGFKKDEARAYAMAAGNMYIAGCKHCKGFLGSGPDAIPICGHLPNEYPGLDNTPADSTTKPKRIGWKWALETIETYFEFYKADYWVPLKVEEVVGKVIYQDNEIRVLWKAKLDLFVDTNQGLRSVDHKSMSQNRDMTSMNNQFMGQCLVTETRGVVVDKIGLQTSLEPKERFIRPIMNYSASRLLEFQSETVPYLAKILLNHTETGFWPKNHEGCQGTYGMCDFEKVCSGDPDDRQRLIATLFKKSEKWDPINETKD